MHHALITAKKNKAEELVHYLRAQSECWLGALIGHRSAPCGPASAHCAGITSMVKTQEKGPIPFFFFLLFAVSAFCMAGIIHAS